MQSLRVKINAIYFTALLVIIFSVYFVLTSRIRTNLLESLRRDMKQNVLLLDRYLQESILESRRLSKEFEPDFSRRLTKIKNDILPYRITLIRSNGIVVGDSDSDAPDIFENHRYRREVREALQTGYGSSIRYSTTTKRGMLYFAHYNGDYVLRIARQLTDVDRELGEVNRLILVISLVLLVVVFLLNAYISWYITRPIMAMSAFARSYRENNLTERMPVVRSDEIGELQTTMNDMAQELESLVSFIKREKRRLENVISTITEGLVLIDNRGEIRLINSVFRNLFPGHQRYRGRPYYQIVNVNILNRHIERNLEKPGREILELELLYIEEKIMEATLLPVQEEQAVLVILRDVTEQKRFERMKSDFVANASHELKTPLSIIRGYIESLLAAPGLDNKQHRNFLERIDSNLERLSSIVVDITTLSKFEDGVRYFSQEPVDLFAVLDSVILSLQTKIDENNITLTCRKAGESRLDGNADMLESLFYNLVDNAINYNEDGGRIDIECSVQENGYEIRISNTGNGFSPEQAGRLFERFYRVDTSRSRNRGGTGLGLSIVKHAVLFHGGSIEAFSQGAGMGAEFVIFFPCEPREKD